MRFKAQLQNGNQQIALLYVKLSGLFELRESALFQIINILISIKGILIVRSVLL